MKLDASTESVGSELGAPCWLKGVTDGAYGTLLCEAEERTGYSGEEVRMFVGVEMGDVDACVLQLLDLGEGFAFEVVFANGSAKESLYEVEKRGAKGFAVWAEERGDTVGWRNGGTVGEDDMATDPEGWIGLGDAEGVVKGWAGGHKGGGGKSSSAV